MAFNGADAAVLLGAPTKDLHGGPTKDKRGFAHVSVNASLNVIRHLSEHGGNVARVCLVDRNDLSEFGLTHCGPALLARISATSSICLLQLSRLLAV